MIQTPASRTLAKLLVLAAALAVAIGCFVAVPQSAFAGSPAPAGMVYVNGKSGSN